MPRPTIISYTLEDENGESGTVPIYVSYNAATETIAALLGAAAVYGAFIDAVTGCVITGFNINVNALPDPAWKDTPTADTDIQKGLLLNFDVADTTYPQSILIPGVLGSLIDANGHPIVGSGAIDALTDGIVAAQGGVSAQNKFLLDLTALRDAGISFRKRKGSLSKSKVQG